MDRLAHCCVAVGGSVSGFLPQITIDDNSAVAPKMRSSARSVNPIERSRLFVVFLGVQI
jgi:hypothetical protein